MEGSVIKVRFLFRFCQWIGTSMVCGAVMFPEAIAQDSAGEIKAEIRVAATAISGGRHQVWARTGNEGESLLLQLNTHSFSRPVIYQGPKRLDIYATPDAAVSAEAEPLASLELSGGSWLLVFVPEGKEGDYRIVNRKEDQFGYGSLNFVNLSSSRLLFSLGEKKEYKALLPDKNFICEPFSGEKSFSIKIAASGEGESPQMIRQTRFSSSPEWREMIVFFDHPSTKRVTMKHLIDTRPRQSTPTS
jgi:hypothetical protein